MRVLTAFFVICAIGFVAADDAKKEATKLKGKWSAVSIKHAGQAAPDDFLKTFKCNFEEKTYNNVINEEVVEEGEYTIDDSKSPKTIDFEIKKGRDEGKKQIGIFKIDGDKLTMVVAEAGEKDRPTSFKIEEGASLIEAVLERVKP
jgi:uncharacterized protein (TIGR03067 family)